MKSLYESILDVDNEKLDHASVDALIDEYNREWDIHIKKENGHYCIDDLIVKKDKNGIIHPSVHPRNPNKSLKIEDTPSIESLFNKLNIDIVVKNVSDAMWDGRNPVYISELHKIGIYPQRRFLYTLNDIRFIDADIDEVFINEMSDKSKCENWMSLINQHVKHLNIVTRDCSQKEIVSSQYGWSDLLTWINCKCKVIQIATTDCFGPGAIDVKQTIQEYLESNQDSTWVRYVKIWLKRNPKTTLVLARPYRSQPTYEKIINRNKLSAKTVSQDEIDKMI